MTFEDPILVSQGVDPDEVLVKLNKDLFLVPSRYKGFNSEVDPDEDPYFILAETLPKMFGSEDELSTVEFLGSTASSAITTAVVIPMAAGILLKGILSKLWAMLNTLQLINALSIISIKVPNNVMKVQQEA